MVRVIAVALVCAFFGCKPGDQVTVSGAVAQPGRIAYQAGNSAEAYIKAAGGATGEALIDEVYLTRGEDRFPDGHRELITKEGHEVTLFSDGQQVSRLKDGSVVRQVFAQR